MKSFAARLSAFILLLTLLQYLVSSLFPVEIPQEVLRLEEHLANQVDIVFLGDSTLSHPVGEVTTGEILQEMLPDYAVGEISHPAYNLDLYLHHVRYIAHGAHRPRVIVMPINIRSFSPEWDMRPSYQFERVEKTLILGLFLSQMLLRPLEAFGVLEPRISQDTFLNTSVYNGDTLVGTVRDFESLTDEASPVGLQGDAGFVYRDALPSTDDEEALRQALVYRYMYSLKPDHRKLQAMLEIARLGEENHIDTLFYITPINYQQGERLLGDAFSAALSRNAGLVKSLLSEDSDAVLLDLGFDLEAYAFVDMEHLRETGKAHVAEQIAAAIRLESSVASSGSEPTQTPTVPSRPSSTAAPTVTASPVRPSPSPATLTPEQTATETLTAAAPTATLAAPTPTPLEPTLSSTVSTTMGTVTPQETAAVSSTPTLTVTPPITIPDGDPRGALVDVEYLWRSWPNGKYAVDMYRLRYETVDRDGQIAEIQADLFVPYVEVKTTFPVLVHAPGTTGISNGCAPSSEQARQRNWGLYRSHSLAYAARGYIVVYPNGLGFDDPDRSHPYFVAQLEAHVLLDAARAVYSLKDSPLPESALARPAEAIFFMGYSSGGHAVFAAKDWAGSYAPELPVKGIIGFGPTTNVETLLREDPVFSPYIIYAYRDFYGSEIIGAADVFLPAWVPTFDSDVLSKCVDDIFNYYSRSARAMYSPEFREILYGDRLDQVFPLFAEKLSANYAGVSSGSRIPVLILQGTADTVVTPDSQRAFKDQLCEQGGIVTYLEYTAIPHAEIRWTSFSDVLAWMQRIERGELPETDCEVVVPSSEMSVDRLGISAPPVLSLAQEKQ
ncbi:MAG: hypothetical protein H8D77_00870 [Chloroflexi bacterium]|nr:hypothetical protein [Chloroflexota bacterium]MBL7201421.1 hypothetical protein [Anaerolineae bacterium]